MIMVPGFGGFDILGNLKYYEGVLEILLDQGRWKPKRPLCLHFFPNLPAAGVATRARSLGTWLAKRRMRGTFQAHDAIHLIGHSTGGLDIRQLILDLSRAGDSALYTPLPVSGSALLSQVRSIQFLSTPHRGTNIARWMCVPGPLPRILVRQLLRSMRLWGSAVSSILGSGLCHLLPGREPADLLRAAADSLRAVHSVEGPYERARAREAYYALLRWLDEMASDTTALEDLLPVMEGRRVRDVSPAHRLDDPAELKLYEDIFIRSIITVAAPRSESFNLYSMLHSILNFKLPGSVGTAQPVPTLLGTPNAREEVRLSDNDGIVNSVSMIWPTADKSFLVKGDHADIIGHFGTRPGWEGYDLLPSAAGFDREKFKLVWGDILEFISAAAEGRYHRSVKAPRPVSRPHLFTG